MSRRTLLAVTLAVMLMAVVAIPAAAQSEDEYEIRDISLLSYGENRSFRRVVTGERSLLMVQEDAVCQQVGLDYAIGIDKRFRFEGMRTTAVT